MQVEPGSRAPMIIDFYSQNNAEITHFFHLLLTKKYNYGMMFLPHDAARASLTGHRSIYQQMIDSGYDAKVLPKTSSVISDLPAVRDFMQQCRFDSFACKDGLIELEYYEYKQDHFTGSPMDSIKENGHKDAADAFRYLALGTLAYKPPSTPSENRRVFSNIKRAWDALRD
jgi:phage terminase large subunit